MYELTLQSEYSKWVENRFEEEAEDNKIIFRNSDEYDEIARRLDRGEDIDLHSLMTPSEDWEPLDGDR